MRRRPQVIRACSTVALWPHGVCSTSLVGNWDAISSTPYRATCSSEFSTRGRNDEAPTPYHARCPYCGTARKPFTYMNCINCGAPA